MSQQGWCTIGSSYCFKYRYSCWHFHLVEFEINFFFNYVVFLQCNIKCGSPCIACRLFVKSAAYLRISISAMDASNQLSLNRILSEITRKRADKLLTKRVFTGLDYVSNMACVLPFPSTWAHHRRCLVAFVLIIIAFCVVFFVLFLFCVLCPLLPVSLCCPFLIASLILYKAYKTFLIF